MGATENRCIAKSLETSGLDTDLPQFTDNIFTVNFLEFPQIPTYSTPISTPQRVG